LPINGVTSINKKLPRLFKPNIRLYFMMLIAFAVSTFFIGDYYRILAGVQIVIVIFLAIYSRVAAKRRTAKLLEYLESISDSMDLTMRETPLPLVIYSSETGSIIWASDMFISISNLHDPFFELNIADLIPDFSWDWLLSGKNECPDIISIGDREYRIYGNIVSSEREYFAMNYFFDVTDYARTNKEYTDSRLIFTILTIDNYDELLKGMSEKDKSVLLSNIDEKISIWAGGKDGYLCKFDRDRYFYLFEERHLGEYIDEKFSILDTVREEVGADGVHATLCVGIGMDGDSPNENYRFASLGVEMALSRGGDQAVLKNKYGFEFFGGHSPLLEKRTKVKSRIMANAFGELLADASKVYVMGHKTADFDSIGAAIGVCCIARSKRREVRVIVQSKNNPAQSLIDLALSASEYRDVFISEQEAILEADSKTLLVVVDTTRPEQVESESLLLSCTRIAVVDHHRRAADYIQNAVLNFHEPHASSTSELVTEMIQYLVDNESILRIEAEALLTGIVLDTKGFTMNTSSGTFDAAAFLRRIGADGAAVKKHLQSDIQTATGRYALMRGAYIYRDGVAVSSSEEKASRISIAQAADELLNISGVVASFVVATDGEDVFVSARSIGRINVQLILEKLGGGGGSQMTAGLQVRGSSVGQVVSDLKTVIDEYFDT